MAQDEPVTPGTDTHRITLRLRGEVHRYLRDRAYQNKVAGRPGDSVTALVNNVLEGLYHEHQQSLSDAEQRALEAGLVTRD